MSHRPVFVVLEGIDGSGTTTQGDKLQEALEARGHKVLRTREPTDGEIGVLLRRALRHQSARSLNPQQVALLFAADRIDHCLHEIGPALAEGTSVICDRYLASSLTFQVVDGEGGITTDWIESINHPILTPDLTFLIDVPVEVSLARIAKRGKPLERFEVEATLREVRERYLYAARHHAQRLGQLHIVDGQPAPEEVAARIQAHLAEYMAR